MLGEELVNTSDTDKVLLRISAEHVSQGDTGCCCSIWKQVPATQEGKSVSAKLPEGTLIAFLTLYEEGAEPSSVGGSSSFWRAE